MTKSPGARFEGPGAKDGRRYLNPLDVTPAPRFLLPLREYSSTYLAEGRLSRGSQGRGTLEMNFSGGICVADCASHAVLNVRWKFYKENIDDRGK